jgi:hypothetical protein
MTPALHALAVLCAASATAVLAVQVVAQLAAWRDERGRAACPAEDGGPSPTARARAVLRETLLSLAVLAAWPLAPGTPSGERRRAVVLVHGFASSPASLWLLAHRLRRDGWIVIAPRLGPWWRDLADAADRLAGHLDRVRSQLAGCPVAMVAHGLGGLAARLALQRDGRAADVRWLVTLGTPHGGTLAFSWLGLGPFRSDVRPGSTALRALRSARLPVHLEAVAIASPDDALLLPPEQARWPDACNVSVEGSGHLGLLVSARVYELIAENLAPGAMPAAHSRGD